MSEQLEFSDQFLKKLEYLHIVSRKVFSGFSRAERRSHRVGTGIEFADHRDYAPGDDLRTIDWNVYGRMDKLLLRLFQEEEDLSIYLLLDVSRSMGIGKDRPRKLHYAATVTAALCYIGLANLDRVGIGTFSRDLNLCFPLARGKERIFLALRLLKELQAEGQTDLGKAMRDFVHQTERRGLVVLVSDLCDPKGFEEGVNLLRYHRFEPHVVHVVDPWDARPPLRGELVLVDCETEEQRHVTVSPSLLNRYSAAYRSFLDRAQSFCTARHIPYFRAETEIPFDELVLRIFRRGGFLR